MSISFNEFKNILNKASVITSAYIIENEKKTQYDIGSSFMTPSKVFFNVRKFNVKEVFIIDDKCKFDYDHIIMDVTSDNFKISFIYY